jgi:hypothetical protein
VTKSWWHDCSTGFAWSVIRMPRAVVVARGSRIQEYSGTEADFLTILRLFSFSFNFNWTHMDP